jgi:drug/metabolite transporter (DMT)-like permease
MQRSADYEPADRPIRWYEFALCLVTQLLVFACRWTPNPLLEYTAIASTTALMATALWKLLLPPRLSATRCAFVLIGLIGIVLLFLP